MAKKRSSKAEQATPDDVEERVREAVGSAQDVRAEVERITRDALTRGHVDFERMAAVAQAVGRGATQGASARPQEARRAVSDAVAGLESVFIDTARDLRLAAQEAGGRVGSAWEGEFKRSVEDLQAVESLMLDALERATRAGRDAGADVLDDVVRHARRSGTRLRDEVDAGLRDLASGLPEAMRELVLAGVGVARETGAIAAEAASGVLTGIAGALRATPRTGRGQDRDDETGRGEDR